MEALRVNCVYKNFGSFQALSNVSLSIESSERRGLIGPNGAGKTTLFNLITGQLRPTAGEIYLYGQEITHMPAHQRIALGLGRTFQITNVFLELTVLNNVLLALQALQPFRYGMWRPLRAHKSIFDEAESLLGTWDFWDKRDLLMKELSYGDQRAMELILCLASKPKILLLDEPTAGLSPTEVAIMTNAINRLGQDITLFIIEHDMDVVFNIAENIAVLHHGEIIADGKKEQIRADLKVQETYLGIRR